MHLFFLITGIVLFPQAYALICNKCRISVAPCVGTEEKCPAESTRCITMRTFTYMGMTKNFDRTEGSCAKPQHCNDASFNAGVERNFATTKCCDTDKCNTELPPLPDLKSKPNGKKCYRCDGKGDCTGTVNCDGDQTYCATGEGEEGPAKGCATKSMCVEPSPHVRTLQCCEGNYCNGSTSTSVSLMLLTTMTFSLFFFSN
ncbi:urokinase plasminogen activator surface receptor-like [Eucyclogobius newberryi]|uniref:urokinase plasminogen activator surface receptor-like n=1 Tax=Eucyclogobius newberryi TaxID=166745 RepID=UPI003B5BA923